MKMEAPDLFVQMNDDTANGDYLYQRLVAQAATATAAQVTADTAIRIGYLPDSTAAGEQFASLEATIFDDRGAGFKDMLTQGYCPIGLAGGIVSSIGGQWRKSPTEALSKLYVAADGSSGLFVAGSKASLYGRRA
jgi:hypothetical protein